jgi:riboflavin kinase/FMN adenylyltransferase
VVGADTRFGHRNSGDVATLRELGAATGFEVEIVPEFGVARVVGDGSVGAGVAAGGDGARRWSSSWVRELLTQGDVARAAQVLGRPHRVTGVVVHGDHRGRELGYPTANLGPVVSGLVPADGVYAGWLLRPGLSADDPDSTMPAAVSIGTNPTFDGTQRRVEAYVLDRTDLDLYGESVALELVERLRPTERYDSVEALLEQMGQDVERCRTVLSSIVPS